jgi:hypothetical protein
LPTLGLTERPHRQHPVHISNLLSMGGVERLVLRCGSPCLVAHEMASTEATNAP